MPEILIDGFRFSRWAGGKQLLVVESDRLPECIEYCNQKQINWLHISPYHGYHLDNVDFLCECKHVTGISMQRGFSDYGGLYQLPRLASLSVIFTHDIRLSELPALSDLSTDWSPQIEGTLLAAKLLKRLWLRGYKPKCRDLSQMEALKHLDDLHIILSPIRSVRGIEALSKLKKLGLSYCYQLEDIRPISKLAGALQELEISHCKKIKDITYIRVLKRLRKAILSDSGNISSLNFIRRMPRLEFLSFVGTNVLDGDMTPCFKLKYAGFLKKRHYSHSPEQVADIIGSKTPVRGSANQTKTHLS